jgi:predicted nucleic acid-binding protein
MIVVDASVAVKWLIAEDGADAARDLLAGREPLVVPSLARVEVVGAVLRKHRAGLLDEAEVRLCLALWADLLSESLSVVGFEECLERATAIALACGHPLSDCIYVATAERCDAALITADAPLRDRCRKAYPRIELLAVPAMN